VWNHEAIYVDQFRLEGTLSVDANEKEHFCGIQLAGEQLER